MDLILITTAITIVATAAFSYLIYFRKLLALNNELNNSKLEKDRISAELQILDRQQHELQAKNLILEKEFSAQSAKLETLVELRKQLEKKELDLAAEVQSHKQTKDCYIQEQVQHAQLRSELVQKELAADRQIKQLLETREDLKKEFENLANNILEIKAKNFKEQNAESISNLLNPLKEEMKGFKERVETIHKEDIEQQSTLKAELLNLQNLNRAITDQAAKLTNALRADKKKIGNWGELVLSNVLENSGLRYEEDYLTQKSFKNDDGKLVLPDAIVKLPQGKHIIIDAKTSLVSYTDYVNCEEVELGQKHLAAHAAAVSDRINELSDKNYFKIPELNSPEVVIMFIPIESAYVEALRFNKDIFQRALQKNILVATPTTLLTSLNIVAQLWRFEAKNKHTAELARRADHFHTKLGAFLETLQKVGQRLDDAKASYESALGQFYQGRGNLIKQAAEFKDLGIAVQRELPSNLVEKAKLELDILPRQ